MKRVKFPIKVLVLVGILFCYSVWSAGAESLKPQLIEDNWFFLGPDQLDLGKYHTRHAEVFGESVQGTYNYAVLEGIDKVQKTTNGGGGYFIGIKANPTESPVGYPLRLFDLTLIDPPRTTSYCSGSSYAAFIESLNIILPEGQKRMNLERFEACRMQEPDGGRREDEVKFWGHWNDDGFGSHYALGAVFGYGI